MLLLSFHVSVSRFQPASPSESLPAPLPLSANIDQVNVPMPATGSLPPKKFKNVRKSDKFKCAVCGDKVSVVVLRSIENK